MEIFIKDRKFVFKALKKAKFLIPDKIISEVKASGLRGRGGAGFPAGLKWELVSKENSTPKYIVCNAHEGEPETLKDKYLLENFPYLVLGGMLIAAKAINSKDLFITIKKTYKKAIVNLKKEILNLKKAGLLKDLKITIFPAELGYIGGEETALLNELEGKRIEPRIKPPFVSQAGLFRKPTIVNNVESFANTPFIIAKGAKEFRKFGTKNSPGKKLITVSGNVKNPGVYEIEFGQTLNEILEIVGKAKGKIKFALTGGFAGTVVTPEKFDIPFEYDSGRLGVCVGAGTIIFYNEKTNLLGALKTWLEFFKDQSCGQCTPCREGTFRLYEIIKNSKDKISQKDFEKIKDLFFSLENSSFCPLGVSASMAARGLIKAFYKELVSE